MQVLQRDVLSITYRKTNLKKKMHPSSVYIKRVPHSCRVCGPPECIKFDRTAAFAIDIDGRAVLPEHIADILHDGFARLAAHGFTRDGRGLQS